jgi:hypothetical protein
VDAGVGHDIVLVDVAQVVLEHLVPPLLLSEGVVKPSSPI